MTRSRLTVGKTKGIFYRKIESKRREKVSESVVLKWNRQRVENDHGGYCTTSTASFTEQDHGHCQPDISDVQNDIPCSNIKCKYINNVPTALTHAGIGVTQLNIPPVHHKLADKRKTDMGLAVESVAHDSILGSIEEETALTQQ
ncbi:hypothetical protein FSP39_004538 [Pinctada imbricata]|uniref:Uncharacterized protein n=1 Tax=Pinctada imbricata TaxID=66713 RepID=A0AA88YUE5_PINIB|nr:hypothetical protein FSP39_004538 [Pinctada imbricata]